MPLDASHEPDASALPKQVDVLIIGAGISGVGAGWRLRKRMPDRSFLIVEAREDLGGTWDLFRYPGIRSDSDMYTLGFSFKPWRAAKAIADGPSIKAYLKETVEEAGLAPFIRFRTRVVRMAWESASARWTVELDTAGGRRRVSANFVFSGAGYYRYDRGYTPDFPGLDRFTGRFIHPQHWPGDFDHAGKRVVVIGSGATAVTIVPEVAKTAAHVVMLQRSPTYMVARPSVDPLAERLKKFLPTATAYGLIRWKNIALQLIGYRAARTQPQKVKEQLFALARAQLPADYDFDRHFRPRYNPWEQRLCLVPDGDFFAALSTGKASIVTDEIAEITPGGVRLKSGGEIEADAIVSATGLDLQLLGGAEIVVDGKPVELGRTVVYRGMMFSGVPNFANVFGYTNASWTLRADLVADRVCRLLRTMQRKGARIATPVHPDPASANRPFLDFSSGYVTRAMERFPKQDARAPWRINQNFGLDVFEIRYSPIDDGAIRFSSPPAQDREIAGPTLAAPAE